MIFFEKATEKHLDPFYDRLGIRHLQGVRSVFDIIPSASNQMKCVWSNRATITLQFGAIYELCRIMPARVKHVF